MAVIQPGIKSVFAKNITGTPLLLSYATFILNIDAPFPVVQATNGSYRFKYKADTSKMELSTDNGQTYSGDHSVTSDGSTFNSNVGSSRLDFILQSNPNEGDEFEAVIKDTVSGEDTRIDGTTSERHKNFGGDNFMSAGFTIRGREALIRFNIQTYLSDLLGTEAEGRFNRTISSFIRIRSISSPVDVDAQFFSISDNDGDWIPGTADGVIQTGSPDWVHKVHDTVNWTGGVGTPEITGSAITEKLTITTAEFFIFNDNGGLLNTVVDRWFKSSVNLVNNGIRPIVDTRTNFLGIASSENSTGDWRPLLCFIYEVIDGENHGIGGGGFVSSGDKPDKELEFAKSLQITDEIDDTYATEFGSQE